MGPSVKLVLTIIDAFPNQKNGGNFFVAKKDKPGGARGGFVFRTHFFRLSFLNISLIVASNLGQNWFRGSMSGQYQCGKTASFRPRQLIVTLIVQLGRQEGL